MQNLLDNHENRNSMLNYEYTCREKFKVYGNLLPQIMAQVFISFQQPFTVATKRNQWLYETGVYYLKLWIKLWGDEF